MKNNNVLAVLLFIVIASVTLPFFNFIADGQFYWGIAPSFIFAILFYLQAEKTTQERNENLNSSIEYQSVLENILKQNSIDSRNTINSLKEENLLSQKKNQETLELQTHEFNKNMKLVTECFELTTSNGIKANNEQIISLQRELTNSINELGKQIVQSFVSTNDKLTDTIEMSFGKQEATLSGIHENLTLSTKDLKEINIANQENINHIQEIFTTNIILIKDTIVDNNNSYKGSLEKMTSMVDNIKINHKIFVESIATSQVDLQNTVKTSFRTFDDAVKELPNTLETFVKDSQQINSNFIESFIENNEDTQKAYIENSREILEDLKNLHRADEQLITKLLLENDKN
jgi:hypothetical protein